MLFRHVAAAAALLILCACSPRRVSDPVPQPRIIPHAEWDSLPRLGYAANAARRNIAAGDSLSFLQLRITVLGTQVDSSGAKSADRVRLRLAIAATVKECVADEGSAFMCRGFYVAVVAIYGVGELGAGLIALEVRYAGSLESDSRVIGSELRQLILVD